MEGAATLAALWISTTVIGSLLMASICEDKWPFTHIVFEVTSALGSEGLSTGISSNDLPATGKCVLIFLMRIGRLELIAALALFWMPFAQQSKTPENYR